MWVGFSTSYLLFVPKNRNDSHGSPLSPCFKDLQHFINHIIHKGVLLLCNVVCIHYSFIHPSIHKETRHLNLMLSIHSSIHKETKHLNLMLFCSAALTNKRIGKTTVWFAPDRGRTCDFLLRKQTLYPLSYRRNAEYQLTNSFNFLDLYRVSGIESVGRLLKTRTYPSGCQCGS